MRKEARIVILLTVMLVVLSLAINAPQVAMARHRWPRPTPTTPPPPPTPATTTPPPPTSSTTLVAPEALWPPDEGFVEAHPTLRWTAVPGAVRYHLQASLVEYWGLTQPGYLFLAHPEAYNPYVYWRVQAIDANNVQGPWSKLYHFTITTPYTVHDISSHGLTPWP